MNGTIYKFSGYVVVPGENEKFFNSRTTEETLKGGLEETDGVIFQHLHAHGCMLADVSNITVPNCDLSLCQQYFYDSDYRLEDENSREVKVGEKYRHFKIGKIVEVIAVATHTESPDSKLVIYKHNDEVWARPLEMFISKVDKVKYPDATQEYRFELVKE